MLDVASRSEDNLDKNGSLRAIAIGLGHTRHQSMWITNQSHKILSVGNENERTQGLIHVLSREHIEKLRSFYTQDDRPMYAEEAYLLSLFHNPDLASREDANVLCDQFNGIKIESKLGKLMAGPNPQNDPVYYPAQIYGVMTTALKVFG